MVRPQFKKSEAEYIQELLDELLCEEDNKSCADCGARQPRWASWNMGVFICIRCAAFHRKIGVHITKVKSVNLDSWTHEQVQSVRAMGNAKARAVYEALLPENFCRPSTDAQLESFIRSKYEHKIYMLRDWAPPPINIEDLPSKAILKPRLPSPSSQSSSLAPPASPARNIESSASLIDMFQGRFKLEDDAEMEEEGGAVEDWPMPSPLPPSCPPSTPVRSLTDLRQQNDMFGDFISSALPISTPETTTNSSSNELIWNPRDVKKSNTEILSLFAESAAKSQLLSHQKSFFDPHLPSNFSDHPGFFQQSSNSDFTGQQQHLSSFFPPLPTAATSSWPTWPNKISKRAPVGRSAPLDDLFG